ncbi:MAG: immunity 53 family protein [Acidobacteriaceae bacterium]
MERLRSWYESNCNGDWEHQFGIAIVTLDNPGWSVEIDLKGTPLEQEDFEKVTIDRSEKDWAFASKQDGKFRIACGVRNLDEALRIFCDWAGI